MLVAEVQEKNKKLPDELFKYVNRQSPFVFLDFEVFKYDWLVCFSLDGEHIKTIVNDTEKLKDLFLHKLADRIMIAYNGNSYDKLIMLALLNGINPKEANDNIINNFNFNFMQYYGADILYGRDLMWWDPISRNAGSLKTYEACQGENIYESNVDFDLPRKLTPEEIEETKQYCSFDTIQLINYFYKETFDTFLGHIGLINLMLQTRTTYPFHTALAKSDAALVGLYLCSDRGVDPTGPTDIIRLPDNIHLGKYTHQVEQFLSVPIKILSNGEYNGLGSWALNLIDKSLALIENNEPLIKAKGKEEKLLKRIKKNKEELLKLKDKQRLAEQRLSKPLTLKQTEKVRDIPELLEKLKNDLIEIRGQINILELNQQRLQELKILLDQIEDKSVENIEYANLLADVVQLAHLSDNTKLELLIKYLRMSESELFDFMYSTDKKMSSYNEITIVKPFETIIDIKGVPHLFKTGGIHSVFGAPMMFDTNRPEDANRCLLIADVGSLYPNLMRVFQLCSVGMDDPGKFAQMIFDRIALKKQKDPFANVLKLILNTTYGCMGSIHNNLYDPANRLKVCIYGQASIVDLLDKLEDQIPSLEIFQSNTDGIIIACDNPEKDKVEEIIHDWENRTGLEMEIDYCTQLWQKDVSNYILIS